MMRIRAVVLSVVVAALAALSPGAVVGGATPPAACSLITQDEVVLAFGAPIGQVGDEPATCTFGTDPLAMTAANLVVELRSGDPATGLSLLEQARAAEPAATELTIGGVPALQGPVEAGPAGGTLVRLHLFPDEATWVVLTGDAATESIELPAVLASLAELMLPRLGVVAPLETLCDLWSVDQVATALGGEQMRLDRQARSATSCGYVARKRTSATQLLIALGTGDLGGQTLEQVIRDNFADVIEVPLSDPELLFLHRPPEPLVGEGKGWTYTSAFLITDDITGYQIIVQAPKGVDGVAALAGLLEAALPALAATQAPTASASPSPAPVGDIADLFPTEIGGGAADVQPQENRLAGQPARAVRQLERLLGRQDRTLVEFRLAIAGYPSGDLILAVQLPGGRMAPLADALRDVLGIGGKGRSVTVGGKKVRVVEPYHVYVAGDTLWAITAEGAALEEILQKLP